MGAERAEDAWCALVGDRLDVAALHEWVVRPDCGAVVVFTGTARDHAADRTGVTLLEYEAYDREVVPRLEALAVEARSRWPGLGRVALHHRVGDVPVGEAAVCVAVSAPHRGEAFDAARWAIDTLKATVPIWKKEHHDAGADWGLEAQHLEPGEPHRPIDTTGD